jgi:phytoene desaturase
MRSVLVVGAGIGGLAVAARLAQAGYRVTVLEKQAAPGGRTALLDLDGYRFDTGPTLFLMPAVFAETYKALGERMEDHLDLTRLDPTYRVHFHDGSSLDLTSDLIAMRQQLDALEPGSFARYLSFLNEGYRHYTLSLQHFVGRDFRSYAEYFAPRQLPLLFKLKALQKHAPNVAGYFRDRRLRAAFSFQNMYLGLSPYDAPATYSLLQYTELCEGVWYPRGGLFRVIESLEQIAKGLGVTFHYNAPVVRINVDGQRATGVTLSNGETLAADLVIANADLPYVYKNLLPADGAARQLDKKRYTSSALMFYWAVKGERSPELLHHNLFLADHLYKQSFDQIFREHTLPNEPSFYINRASASDPSVAPASGDAIMALVPVGHISETTHQDWDRLTERARNTVIGRLHNLGVRDLGARIIREAAIGPREYQHELNLDKGAAFGLSHDFWQVGYLRPRNRHARYGNLYFVGASTHPGTGLPIVLLSARLVAERIAEEHR